MKDDIKPKTQVILPQIMSRELCVFIKKKIILRALSLGINYTTYKIRSSSYELYIFVFSFYVIKKYEKNHLDSKYFSPVEIFFESTTNILK